MDLPPLCGAPHSGGNSNFPFHRVSEGRDERLRVTFGTALFVYSAVFEGQLSAGRHEHTWDGTDADGRTVAPGVYVVRASVAADASQAVRARTVNVAY